MKQFWNQRYAHERYAYGKNPNTFFKEQLDQLPKGRLLLPADGEGRNAVYAASQGWESSACDLSEEGQAKAIKLAESQKVQINYVVGDFGALQYENAYFDAVALIYAHFPAQVRAQYHKLADAYLKEGGHVIIEAFSKNHLKYQTQNPSVGGPKNEVMLFSVAQLQADFPNYKWHILEEQIIELHEGEYHRGTGSVVRAVGEKGSV